MHSGILDMLRDGIFNHLTLIGYGVKLNLLGLLHKLRHHYGELLAHLSCHGEETLQLVVAMAYVHRSSREHV